MNMDNIIKYVNERGDINENFMNQFYNQEIIKNDNLLIYNYLIDYMFINKYDIKFHDSKMIINKPDLNNFKILFKINVNDNNINFDSILNFNKQYNILTVYGNLFYGHTGSDIMFKENGYFIQNNNSKLKCFPKKYWLSDNLLNLNKIIACIKHITRFLQIEGARNNNPSSYFDTFCGKNLDLTIYLAEGNFTISLDRYLEDVIICEGNDDTLHIFYTSSS